MEKVSQRIALRIACFFIIILLLQLLLFQQIYQRLATLQHLTRQSAQVSEAIENLYTLLKDAEQSYHAYMASGITAQLNNYHIVTAASVGNEAAEHANGSIQRNLQILYALTSTPNMEALAQDIQKKLQFYKASIMLRQNNKAVEAIAMANGSEGKPLNEKIRTTMIKIMRDAQKAPINYSAINIRKINLLIYILFGLSFLAIIGLFILYIFFEKKIHPSLALKNTEESPFAKIFACTTEAYVIFDINHNIIECNQAALDLFGCNRSQLMGKNIGIIWPEPKLSAQSLSERVLCQNFSGKIFSGEVTCIPMEVAQTKQYLTQWRNISTIVQLEQRAENQEARLALFTAATQEGFWDWNILTGKLFCSTRLLKIFGLPSDASIESIQTFIDILPPHDKELALQLLDAHLTTKRPYNFETQIGGVEEKYIWCEIKGQAQWNSEGKAFRMIGVVRDITMEKQAAETRKNIITHALEDLRAELSVIHGALSLVIGDKTELPTKIQQLLEIVYKKYQKLNETLPSQLESLME